jgi:hypothetical protein
MRCVLKGIPKDIAELITFKSTDGKFSNSDYAHILLKLKQTTCTKTKHSRQNTNMV